MFLERQVGTFVFEILITDINFYDLTRAEWWGLSRAPQCDVRSERG